MKLSQIKDFLSQPIDNSALIVFRIVFGLLAFLESIGAIFTGWVHRTFIEPDFTFTFIGFEFLQPLVGEGMYFYYILMGGFALMVLLGFYYRIGIWGFALMWTASYLMQKTSYNNHYYLLIILSFLMILVPANRYFSLDVKRNPKLKSLTCPRWACWIFIAQVWIVYTFAAIAKIYPDWMQAIPIGNWFKYKADYPIIGTWLAMDSTKYLVSYGGIFFDLFIIPLMLFKRTRWLAFGMSLFFHLFNSVVFQIGIFPYLMIGICVFFFPVDKIRKLFFKSKPDTLILNNQKPITQKLIFPILIFYFILQLYLPLRHWIYPGNVTWNEAGHRMAWRMMLRSKSGYLILNIKDKNSEKTWKIYPADYLTPKQTIKVATYPDMAWQFIQFIKNEWKAKGYSELKIYAESKVSLNGKPYQTYINPEIDLANVEWHRFETQSWIMDF